MDRYKRDCTGQTRRRDNGVGHKYGNPRHNARDTLNRNEPVSLVSGKRR